MLTSVQYPTVDPVLLVLSGIFSDGMLSPKLDDHSHFGKYNLLVHYINELNVNSFELFMNGNFP